ncbi:MAG: tryptophan--tRNA ligase [Candidatus Calescibacterium sp.]|nr:tryptophan--tRNA ligase [Candidatus Calescibacterium sp.]MDW8195014.1 tryptophan--tRNA ligase [Candidatus Calescibacterium sp.]
MISMVPVLVSGMRPTGKLHIGHIFGTLNNWVKYQDNYRCYFIIVDWHALTTSYENTKEIQDNIVDVLIDYLACGLDPSKCTIYLQSMVEEVAVLHLILSMITPISWLERVPSFKDQIQQLGKNIATYGFLGYPVLMTADILAFDAKYVPVGQDQIPHLELAREIVRKFNFLYGETFVEPQPILTETPYIPGFDGRKMSKSYNNAIFIDETEKETEEKVKRYITDPQKIYKNSPGRPEICNVFGLHRAFKNQEISEIENGCRAGKLGCVECKKKLAKLINSTLEPIRTKRNEIVKNKNQILDILVHGSKQAKKEARKKLEEVKQKINLNLLRGVEL